MKYFLWMECVGWKNKKQKMKGHLKFRMNWYLPIWRVYILFHYNWNTTISKLYLWVADIITAMPTRISLFDTQKWSLHVHYIEHRFNKEIQKSVEKQNENWLNNSSYTYHFHIIKCKNFYLIVNIDSYSCLLLWQTDNKAEMTINERLHFCVSDKLIPVGFWWKCRL